MDLETIRTPTLLVDEEKCRANIRRMVDKAEKHRVEFIPHFKTHQSRQIGRWFREEGVDQITVSSMRMARYFKEDGWNDITVAFPAHPRQLADIERLASEINLTVFINNRRTANYLDQHLEHEVAVQTEIDTGYRRSGIPHDEVSEIEKMLDLFQHSEKLNFTGFYTHNGQTYEASNVDEIAESHGITLFRLNQLRKKLASKYNDLRLSIGDTPACSSVDNFAGIHSIHPGNFVFYDLNQVRIGACGVNQIAVAVACPLIERRPERSELILHGGAIHLSKDYEMMSEDQPYYGKAVRLESKGWDVSSDSGYVRSLSQEHALLTCSSELYEAHQEGDLIGILPIHSCLTANLMKGYVTLNGNTLDHMEGQ